MNAPKIQLLVFDGCPLADAARRSLQQALREIGLDRYEEIDLLAEETAADMRGWGSPTILIDGEDLTGAPKGNDVGCRVYPGPDRVPSAAAIAERIRRLASE